MGRLDESDRELIAALRGFDAVGSGLTMDFARPLKEPMLWVPDAVAGAVALARKGQDGRYRRRLEFVLEEFDV